MFGCILGLKFYHEFKLEFKPFNIIKKKINEKTVIIYR